MENFLSNFVEISSDSMKNVSLYIKNKGIWIQGVEFEYKPRTGLLVKYIGQRKLALSDNYLDSISHQIEELNKNIIVPLKNVYKNKASFILNFYFDQNGNIDPSNIKIKFRMGQGINNHSLESLLPFAEYIYNIELQGRDYELKVLTAEGNISLDELLDIIEMPIVAPRARKQWFEYFYMAVQDAKQVYSYKTIIPCTEGELLWDQKVETVQVMIGHANRALWI